MSLFYELLEREEKYRLSEQSTLLSALLNNPSKGKLSVLRRAGLALTGLEVIGRGSGSGGRIIVELVNNLLDSTRGGCFKPGEVVKIIVNGRLLDCIGTIERRTKATTGEICVSLSSGVEAEELELLVEGSTKISVIKVVDEAGVFEKMKRNLETVFKSENESGLLSFIREFIERSTVKTLNNSINENSGSISNIMEKLEINPVSSSFLNEEQGLAVKRSLEMIQNPKENCMLIHGPPGTGKTQVLIEILKILTVQPKRLKILILGPSNLSVDNIIERLNPLQLSLLRIGHSSRVLESCQGSTLDFWCENSDAGKLLIDVQREIDELVRVRLPKCKNREERRAIFGELKLLRQERRRREKTLQSDLIGGAEIVVCTLSTAGGKKLRGFKFDLAVIDEAGQALLPETLIAPILADKIILAGDHFQLPPTVMNPEIKQQLEISLFEHLIQKKICGKYEVMLKEQYRMNSLIMQWSNEKFYGNELRAHESVSQWQLEIDCEDAGDVLIFYDTCGFDFWEGSAEKKSPEYQKSPMIQEMSKFNEGEARIVMQHYEKLVRSGVSPESIAIISPYSAQVSLLRDLTGLESEINSIDAFQGREKDVVILSLVRSNTEGVVGFLGEMRRINVAMTRAKKQLVIIGDSETLSRDPDLTGLVRMNKIRGD